MYCRKVWFHWNWLRGIKQDNHFIKYTQHRFLLMHSSALTVCMTITSSEKHFTRKLMSIYVMNEEGKKIGSNSLHRQVEIIRYYI